MVSLDSPSADLQVGGGVIFRWLYTDGSHGERDTIETYEKSTEERVEMCIERIESEASRGERDRERESARLNHLERRWRAKSLERRGDCKTRG